MTDKYSDLKKAAEAANDESRPAYEQSAGVRYLMEKMTASAVLALLADLDEAQNGLKISCAVRLKNRIEELQAEAESLRAGLEKIIEMNRQHAEDQYGDANKAESWSCIRVAREALNQEPQS